MMHRSLLTLAVAVSAALAAPQGLEGLNSCVQGALLSTVSRLSTSCGLTDTACLCSAPGFTDQLKEAISATCGSDDVAAAEGAGAALCADAGVVLPGDSDTPSSDAPASETSADSGEAGTTAAPTAVPSEGSTGGDSMGAGGNTTTTWVNGTCHHCSEGQSPSNGTAPMPSAPAPSSAPAPTEGNSTGPKYTGAASSLAGSAFSALAAAVGAYVLL